MALDKLVDSAQLDSDLGDVADAIRAKSGGSSPLAFPAGFVSEIVNIPSGGGGDTLTSDFLTIYKETVEVGENTVSNAAGYQAYLMSLISIPGNFLGMSIHRKNSYTYNEWANANGQTGYRYRSSWSSAGWNIVAYDAVAPVGTMVDVYTVEVKKPSSV